MNTKKLVLTSLFIVISLIGANFKISSSIALDSFPAFLGALLLGSSYGAIIGAFGHLGSASLSGFPFGIPAHVVIALGMALTMIIFGYIYKFLENKISKTICFSITGFVGVILNGPCLLIILYYIFVPILGLKDFLVSDLPFILPILTLAATLNVVVALTLFNILKKV